MKPELSHFLPYLLNQAAELASRDFQPHYKEKYGMLRTEWRVLFHLGQYGDMTAKQICHQASLHKTKVSRAVSALERKRYLTRTTNDDDRRSETLSLTKSGQIVFNDLAATAAAYDQALKNSLGEKDFTALKRILRVYVTEKTTDSGQ